MGETMTDDELRPERDAVNQAVAEVIEASGGIPLTPGAAMRYVDATITALIARARALGRRGALREYAERRERLKDSALALEELLAEAEKAVRR